MPRRPAQGSDGSDSFEVRFGYSGDNTPEAHGMIPATQEQATVVDDPANDVNTALGTGEGITVHEAEIPAGIAHARFSPFDDYTDGADDLDLYVFGPVPADPEQSVPFVGGAGTATSAEEVPLASLEGDTYLVVVHWMADRRARCQLHAVQLESRPRSRRRRRVAQRDRSG